MSVQYTSDQYTRLKIHPVIATNAILAPLLEGTTSPAIEEELARVFGGEKAVQPIVALYVTP